MEVRQPHSSEEADEQDGLKIITEFGTLFHGPVGTLQELSRYCEHLDKRRRHFSKCCQYMQVG